MAESNWRSTVHDEPLPVGGETDQRGVIGDLYREDGDAKERIGREAPGREYTRCQEVSIERSAKQGCLSTHKGRSDEGWGKSKGGCDPDLEVGAKVIVIG